MSQAKVDRYKEEKRNRKETLRREKRKHLAAKTAGLIVAAALVAWGGYSVYDEFIGSRPADVKTYRIDAAPIDDFMNDLYSMTNEPEAEAEEIDETEAEAEEIDETEETAGTKEPVAETEAGAEETIETEAVEEVSE